MSRYEQYFGIRFVLCDHFVTLQVWYVQKQHFLTVFKLVLLV